jgi:hypothetical protein
MWRGSMVKSIPTTPSSAWAWAGSVVKTRSHVPSMAQFRSRV